ncbi:unnamed protein product [Caenorhabditis sp. 36 PRJEB53466]|nr:unnamed protein product [Caenorhabditis sp. 36 PRJEB53466]
MSGTKSDDSLEKGAADDVEPVNRRESFSALRRNNVAPRQLRVVTLNAWCLPQPWPIGSTDRIHRLQKIGAVMLEENYDIVGLQELWSYWDFVRLSEQVSSVYPFYHYFHSGFTGSGVCVFSRHPIVSTLTHRYSLNGFAHHIHRGDWFGGKVVGLAEIEMDGDVRINFYSTHLHAEYDRENDLYLPHRTSQSFELAQFVRHTARSADVVIVTGDLNMEPCDLGLRMILSHAKLFDAWRMSHEADSDETGDAELIKHRGIAKGGTCDRPDNAYTKRALKNVDESKRIDYMLFKSGRCNVKLEECEITLNQIPGEEINYSDHVGLRARFTVDDRFRHEKSANSWEPNRPLLIEAIGIVAGGERRARTDRTFFLILAAVCLMLILGSLFFDVLPTLFAVFRFALTVLAVFFVWQGFIGLTLERKALKAAKQSIQQILNN